MLKGLDKVDWASLNVPEAAKLIRELTSRELETYDLAFDTLYKIFMQGDCEFAIRVFPFLIKLLSAKRMLHKLDIFVLLSMHDSTRELNECELRMHDVFCQGVDVYLTYLRTCDGYERRDFLWFLCRHKRLVRPVVREIHDLLIENQKPRDDTVWNLGELVFESGEFNYKERNQYIRLFKQWVKNKNRQLAQYNAARWLVKVEGAKVSAKVIDVLAEWAAAPVFESTYLFAILARFGVERGARPLIKVVRTVNFRWIWLERIQLQVLVLDLIFNNQALTAEYLRDEKIASWHDKDRSFWYETPHKVPVTSLNELQQSLISAFVENDTLWDTEHEGLKIEQEFSSIVFKYYGLPDSRDELRALIEKS